MINRMATVMLLAALTTLLVWGGYAVGGLAGLVLATAVAGLMTLGACLSSDGVLHRMYGAEEITEIEAPEVYRIVSSIATRAGLPMPRVLIIPHEAPNAFATGRNPNNAALVVTQGLIRLLSRQEFKAVVAHELGHVRDHDTLTMTVAATIAGALTMLANLALWGAVHGADSPDNGKANPVAAIVGIILAPVAAVLVHIAISRSREFIADESAARLSGNPLALASALRKMEGWSKRIPMTGGMPATAHLFIVNPFSPTSIARLFSTHPSTQERIKRLQKMSLQDIHVR